MMPLLKISSEQDGRRLDVILARLYPDYSRSFMQKWIKAGRVTRSGHDLGPNYRVRAGETIDVADFMAPSYGPSGHLSSKGGRPGASGPRPSKGGRHSPGEGLQSPVVLFEDASILVINKPAGLVVHPAPSHKGLTLVDWLESYLGPKVTALFSDSSRIGVVHRLDKDTTGVLLVAKTVVAQNRISKQFQDRKVKKTYSAFIEGVPKAPTGIISAPVGRSHNVPSRMAVSSSGRPSETSFEVVEVFPAIQSLADAPSRSGAKEVSQVSLHPKTGRTHQIRVHCAAIGHPIVGDRTYGCGPHWSKDFGIHRPLLHAERLELQHPLTLKKISFEAPWPEDMKKALRVFRRSTRVVLCVLSVAFGPSVLRAEESGTHTPVAVKKKVPHASAAPQAFKHEMASLQSQFKSLIEEVSALQDRVTGIQGSLDELDASKRLHDLEKAIPDLNGKAMTTSNITEETKSQVLDLSHKLKTQADMLDQLRDQMDRLQRDLISARSHSEPSTPPAPQEK